MFVGFATVLLFGLSAIIISFTPTSVNKTATWQMAVLFALFALAGCASLWNYAFCRHRFNEKGIYYTTFFREEKFLAWNDIDYIVKSLKK